MSSSGSSWRSSAASTKGNEAQYCETICNMLTMLSCSEQMDAHRVLLAMTNSPESCQSLRRAGCIPLLIQILHPGSTTPSESHPSPETKLRAAKALKNIVHFNPDERMKRKEVRVLRLLESIRAFTNSANNSEPENKHPTSSSTTLMKLSFDDEHKNTMCTLGAIHALADLILSDHKVHGPDPTDPDCILIRRYSCMTLTNLTFGDGVNKALLCSMSEFLTSLVSQLEFENEDIVQVTASVLRNLSWHADLNSKDSLRDALAVHGLMTAAVRAKKESTLKATLSALWNLSAHSPQNKAAVCSTPNALKFLLSLLRRNKSMTIVENAGGILGSVSSHIAGVEEYRRILREGHCFEILLEHLRSPSLAVVSNACGTLWNLSENEEEQRKLLELNAVPMLKSLEYSKHERIRQGASEALRNLFLYCGKEMNELRQISPSCDTDGEEQPLDLTIASSTSSPVRKLIPPPFLNPPIYNGSISSTRSCPDIQKDIQVKQQQKVESSADEVFNYSHYDNEEEDEEEEKIQPKDTVKTYCDEGTPGFSDSGSMVDLSNQAVDTLIQYQVEDTPAVFSRTSSLSSIDENQNAENKPDTGILSGTTILFLSSPAATSPAPNTNTSAVIPQLPKRSVMFSAEETPLMFSRSSSCGSLESCEDLNNGPCESDGCVSEFSRRTSEAVSPSEIPDSPPRAINPEPEQLPVDEPNMKADLIENESKDKPTSSATAVATTTTTTNDELKVFAMEGTPFLISTATSLSDIVGELDNQQQEVKTTTTTQNQLISKVPTIPQAAKPEEPVSKDPVYSDVQLLQKCIKAGRAVGWVKKSPTVVQNDDDDDDDDEEVVDLSHLIQRGRAKLLTRSEDNLKQYTTNGSVSSGSSLVKPFNAVPSANKNGSSQQQPSSTILTSNINSQIRPLKNEKGSGLPSPYQFRHNLRSYSCHVNFLQPTQNDQSVDLEMNQSKEFGDDYDEDAVLVNKVSTGGNRIEASIQPTKTTPLSTANLDKLVEKVSNINLTASPIGHDSSSETSLHIDGTTATTTTTTTVTTMKENNCPEDDNTDETSQSDDVTWADDGASLSSIPSMSITKAMKIVARAEETLSDIEQPTLDSNSLISSTGFHVVDSHQKQIYQKQLLFSSNSSQVSNLMNQKPPEFVDLENSMISVASIKSEIFDDALFPVVMSSPLLSTSTTCHHSQTQAHVPTQTITTTTTSTTTTNSNNNNITANNNYTDSSCDDTNKVVAASPSQSKYDTYVIKRIESPKERRKNDPERYLTRTIAKFDLKVVKPVIPPKPSSATTVTSVRPTRASELRANHSLQHSPTHSATPLNTTLPRNTKLMESPVRGSSHHGITPESSKESQKMQPPLQQQQHPKLNIGGRIGNLFRKGFSKDSEKWGAKKKDIWVKKREKERAFVPPFNYRPPQPNEDGMNGNNSSGIPGGSGKTSSKITTV